MRKGFIIIGIIICAVVMGLKDSGKGNSNKLESIAQLYLDGSNMLALAAFEPYLAEYPDDDMAWTIKGNIHEECDQDDEAEAAYLKAIALNENNFQATCAMGVLFRKKGEYDEALGYYEAAVELEPEYAQAYSSMAVISLKRNRDAEALKLAKTAYGLEQTDPVIVANLAAVYHYNGRLKERDEFTERAEKLGYQSMDRLYQLYSGEITVRDE